MITQTLCVRRGNMNNAAVALALYNRYLKLPSVWKLHDSMPLEFHNESNILLYDGPYGSAQKT